MKKILFVVLCCLCLVGCEKNWKKDFQVSDIKIKVIDNWNDSNTYITYTIKNVSNYTCNSMKAIVEFKSGNLTVEETIYPPIFSSNPLKPNSTITDEDVISHKDYEGYTATMKYIDCYDKSTNN